MRKIYYLTVAFLLPFAVWAQVSLNPQFPSLNEQVTITYNATQGNGALSGVSPVYMHTGLIVEGQNGWQFVQGNWGTADANVVMSSAGANIWTKTITISDFYGVPAGVQVNQLAFVFRNAAGSIVGRASDGSDIFVNITSGQPSTGFPPAGTVDGINYIDDTTVILQLFAPNKDFVYVLGDFNQWQFDEAFRCTKTPDGQRYWLQIDGLTPGQEYRFQYSIDEEDLRVADVYAEKILDPWNDQFISNSRYPNLISYPFGLTTEIVSVLQTAKEEYPWEVETFFRPPVDRLVIYELLVRDFSDQGTYQGVIDKLDYLQNLGINALELMPVNEFEGNESWGYNPSFYFAPDKYYGTADKLKELVDECHKRGIAVILDVVFNHSFGQNPQVRMYSQNGAAGPPTSNNPWFNTFARHPFSPGFDYNHNSPHTQDFVKRALQYWIQEYKIDGYRFDLSKGFTQNNTGSNVNAWSAYDQNRINTWFRIRNEIHEVDPFVYLILEHFADNSEETVLANGGFLMWGNNHFQFAEAGLGFPSNFNGANHQLRGWTFPNMVSYAESHDEERLMYLNKNFGNNSNSGHNTRNESIALSRMEAVAAFNIPLVGPKMIWQFGELGYDLSINRCPNGTINPDCRTANKPPRWEYLQEADRNRLYKVYAALNKLKTQNEAFSSTNYNYDVWGFGKRLIIQHFSMDVVIIANFDVQPLSLVPGFTFTGTWYDYFTGGAIQVNNLNNAFLLQPGEYRVYTSAPLPTPDLSMGTVDVTFQVDMSLENINTAQGGVGISGSWNNFAFQPMTPQGNGIYSYTLTLDEGESVQYKFRNGSTFENPTGECASGSFGNRVFTATVADAELPAVCFATCTACPSLDDFYDVTFNVDVSQLFSIAAAGIHIAGNFNGFAPQAMTLVDEGLYTFTTSIQSGTNLQWKFINGTSFSNQEVVPSVCGAADGFGGFNRWLIVPSEDVVLPFVCWSACGPCQTEPTCNITGGTLSAPANRSFCVGTGSPSAVDVTVSGASGGAQRWALVDGAGNVVASRGNNSLFNLDNFAPGNYNIRYIRYDNNVDISSITNVSQIADLQGCYAVASNAIGIFLRPQPNAGSLSAASPTAVCANAGASSFIDVGLAGFSGENRRYVLTSQALNNQVVAQQLGSASGATFDLNPYSAGTYRVFVLAYQQGVNLQGVQFASQLAGCYELSNPVVVNLNACASAFLGSSPNPSQGLSFVQFSTPRSEIVTLEVYDLSGRLVQQLFQQMANADQKYRLEFNPGNLPNGVYVYRLTTQHEVLIDKFVLAR